MQKIVKRLKNSNLQTLFNGERGRLALGAMSFVGVGFSSVRSHGEDKLAPYSEFFPIKKK